MKQSFAGKAVCHIVKRQPHADFGLHRAVWSEDQGRRSAQMALLGLAADVSQNAAVGVQDLAVHKVGSVACKKHAGANHVVRLTSIVECQI